MKNILNKDGEFFSASPELFSPNFNCAYSDPDPEPKSY